MTEYWWLPSLVQSGPEAGALDQHHHELAAEWLRKEASRLGVKATVIANTKDHVANFPDYQDFIHASPTARTPIPRRGPVLALFPSVKTLRQAELRIGDGSLCVFGGYAPVLDYWITDRNAQPLSDFEPEWLPLLGAEAIEALESAVFYGGNNGFSRPDEKKHARSLMQRLHQLAEPPTAVQVEAYLVTKHNIRHKGVDWFTNEYDS